jgi:Cu+-exporting ATPase
LKDNKNTATDNLICYHCGDNCKDSSISSEDKIFCCHGCKTVYEILNERNLCEYYAIGQNPGNAQKTPVNPKKFEYLDNEDIIKQLIDFSDSGYSKVSFILPQMHCSSCIWLLENLYKMEKGVINSKVDFLKKEISIGFKEMEISLRKVVELLTSIGYEPAISLDTLEKTAKTNENRNLYYKIGISGFVFGNIMLLSFPEYLSLNPSDLHLKRFFSYINVFLSLPVFFYCASGYFISAIKGLRKKVINLDFPLSLGILVLFIRSLYEILTAAGPGYLDSFAGLIFLLLLGKLFQSKTYDTLNFERNYKSYFPISVTVIKSGVERVIPLSELQTGQRIVVRNGELIPADSILFSGEGNIDYSFVTGESAPVSKVAGETIYAGGRHNGAAIELEVIKSVSQSYLTQLWNNNFSKKEENKITSLANYISKYFTMGILLIASSAFLFWVPQNINHAVNAFISVLIVACPCALAMSTPFTLGNALRIFGKNKFYLKNTFVIEILSKVNSIVFDKTGTITKPGSSVVSYTGEILKEEELAAVKSLVRNSAHPLSGKIYNFLEKHELIKTVSFSEKTGKGIEGEINGMRIKLGSLSFVKETVLPDAQSVENLPIQTNSTVHLSVNGIYKGFYKIANSYRNGLEKIVDNLKSKVNFYLLSGDNDGEKKRLMEIFPAKTRFYFNQSPDNKLGFVKKLQENGEKVLMIGDGLNDAGALLQSDAGITVSDDISNFSPACDAILDSESFGKISDFINFSKISVNLIKISFVISFLYNLAGIYIAVQGRLSPLFAAILMPLSSISVVVFATLSTNFIAQRKGLS